MEYLGLVIWLLWSLLIILAAYARSRSDDKNRSDNQKDNEERVEEEREWEIEEVKEMRKAEKESKRLYREFRRKCLGESRWKIFWDDFSERNPGI